MRTPGPGPAPSGPDPDAPARAGPGESRATPGTAPRQEPHRGWDRTRQEPGATGAGPRGPAAGQITRSDRPSAFSGNRGTEFRFRAARSAHGAHRGFTPSHPFDTWRHDVRHTGNAATGRRQRCLCFPRRRTAVFRPRVHGPGAAVWHRRHAFPADMTLPARNSCVSADRGDCRGATKIVIVARTIELDIPTRRRTTSTESPSELGLCTISTANHVPGRITCLGHADAPRTTGIHRTRPVPL